MMAEFGADVVLAPDQRDFNIVMAGGQDRALHFGLGRAIRPHRVNGYDRRHGTGNRQAEGAVRRRPDALAGFFDLEDFAALIVPALGAGTVGKFLLVAVGAFGK